MLRSIHLLKYQYNGNAVFGKFDLLQDAPPVLYGGGCCLKRPLSRQTFSVWNWRKETVRGKSLKFEDSATEFLWIAYNLSFPA